MVNFPVGAGTSGHLIGGALTAVLVGPWTAVLCMTVVLLVQAVLFADGGLTALGTNVTLWAGRRRRGLRRVPPARARCCRAPADGLLAAAGRRVPSVPAAALVFVGLFAVGGVADVPLGAVRRAMGASTC
jgi:cobalt/nickel transport system permease protein